MNKQSIILECCLWSIVWDHLSRVVYFRLLTLLHRLKWSQTIDHKQHSEIIEYLVTHYTVQELTKTTREFSHLPVWPPNSPDLNLIEMVWSWMVGNISRGGWLTTLEGLMTSVRLSWHNVSLESFRELCRSYRQRLLAIHSVNGDRHPNFSWSFYPIMCRYIITW